MSDYTHTGLELVGRHIPDQGSGPFNNMSEAQAAGYDTVNPVTGMYEIGAVIDGVFVPIIAEKASLIFDRIQVGKQQQQAAQDQAAAQQQQTPQPQTNEG